VMRAVSDFGMFQSPIKGKLQGLARFVNGRDVDPLVVTFDSHQMPGVYEMLCNVLDNYHVPFHRDHGFIPHMTLTYIPSDADMPIETIEPIEINFSEVYYVDGNTWYSVDFSGQDNKSVPTKWLPSLDELEEMRIWREVALRRFKKGESLTFDYEPHKGGLPEDVRRTIWARLALGKHTTADEVKAAFEIDIPTHPQTLKAEPSEDILALAASLNNVADALKLTHKESDK